MANAVVEFEYTSGATLTLSLFPQGSDAAGATGKACTERTNCKGTYRSTITEGLTGRHKGVVFSGATAVASFWVDMDDTATDHYPLDRADVIDVGGTVQTPGDICGKIGTPTDLGNGTATLAGNLADIDGEVDTIYTSVSNIANVGSPSYAAPSAYTLTTGNQTSGTYANVDSPNQTYHVHTDAAGTLSLIYHFTLAADEVASSIAFSGRWNGTNDTLIFEVYDWVAAAYSLWFTQAGVTGTTSASDFAKTYPALVAKYTGTGANVGKVNVRIRGTGLTSCTLSVDQLVVGKSTASSGVGYSGNPAISVDSAGTSGTAWRTNGTGDNPCPWADALTLSAAHNMNRFRILPGNTITLGATLTNKTLIGEGWFLSLGAQQISGCTFIGAERVTGTATKGATESWFYGCEFGACSLPEFDAYSCALSNTLTLTEATSYKLHNSYAINIGDGWPVIDFGSAVGATGLCLTAWSGLLTIKNMKVGDTLEITGDGELTLDATCTGGDVKISGAFLLTNNGSGQTITHDDESTGLATLLSRVTGAVALDSTVAKDATVAKSAELTGDSITLAKALEMLAAFAAGKVSASSDAGVTTYTYKKRDGSTTSFTAACSETDGTRATTGSLS